MWDDGHDCLEGLSGSGDMRGHALLVYFLREEFH